MYSSKEAYGCSHGDGGTIISKGNNKHLRPVEKVAEVSAVTTYMLVESEQSSHSTIMRQGRKDERSTRTVCLMKTLSAVCRTE